MECVAGGAAVVQLGWRGGGAAARGLMGSEEGVGFARAVWRAGQARAEGGFEGFGGFRGRARRAAHIERGAWQRRLDQAWGSPSGGACYAFHQTANQTSRVSPDSKPNPNQTPNKPTTNTNTIRKPKLSQNPSPTRVGLRRDQHAPPLRVAERARAAVGKEVDENVRGAEVEHVEPRGGEAALALGPFWGSGWG